MSVFLEAAKEVANNKIGYACWAIQDSLKVSHNWSAEENSFRWFFKPTECSDTASWWGDYGENLMARSLALLLMYEMEKGGSL